MKFLLLGAGGVGVWLGANLVRAGHDVVFIGRERFVEAARRDGLRVDLPGGEMWRLDPIAAEAGVASALGAAPYDAVLLSVKAYDVETAVAQLCEAGALGPHTRVVCFQNGIGAEEVCAARLGAKRVVAGTLTSPISQPSPAAIRLERARGGIGLAAVQRDSDLAALDAAFQAAPLLHARTYADYRAMKWSKLLLNLVGNASGAIVDLSVAAVYADPDLARVEMRMLREAVAVMDHMKIRAVDLPGAPVSWLARAIRVLPDPLLRSVLRRNFAKARGDKRPSLHYDAAHRTGRSEVEYLNGAVVAAGRAAGVPTPVNQALAGMLTDQVHGRVDQSPAQSRAALVAAVL